MYLWFRSGDRNLNHLVRITAKYIATNDTTRMSTSDMDAYRFRDFTVECKRNYHNKPFVYDDNLDELTMAHRAALFTMWNSLVRSPKVFSWGTRFPIHFLRSRRAENHIHYTILIYIGCMIYSHRFRIFTLI